MTKPAPIIVLNGTSSSGKTTLLLALQNRLEEPYLNMGIDRFIWMLPKRYLDRPLWDDVLGRFTTSGDTGERLVKGMHRAIRAAALAGNAVLADHVLVQPTWVQDCAALFYDLPAYLVAVKCPLDVLEQRERDRKDRTLGQARAQFSVVHQHAIYDVEVDTSTLSPEQAAEVVIERLRTPPQAFKRLAGREISQ